MRIISALVGHVELVAIHHALHPDVSVFTNNELILDGADVEGVLSWFLVLNANPPVSMPFYLGELDMLQRLARASGLLGIGVLE
eukprot:4849967-Amphidinium_carterae.1